jgi:hypothetical protein
MERTKGKLDKSENGKVILPKKTIDLLLKQPNSTDVIGLFIFYLNTALRQKMIQIRATDSFCMNGLRLGWTRFYRAKKTLTKHKLIKQVEKGREKNKFGEFYIRINNSERYLDFESPQINNDGEHNGQYNDGAVHGGKSAFSRKPLSRYRESNTIKEKNASPAPDVTGDIKQELLPCPNGKIFGKDHPECLIFDCPIERQCKKYYRENKPPEEERVYKNYQQGICPYGHKFGIDTDEFDDCADCEGWDDCIDTKTGNT